MKYFLAAALTVFSLAFNGTGAAYPLDGYEDTGIRRLEWGRLVTEGLLPGEKQPAGARLSTDQVDIRLLDHPNLTVPPADAGFTRQFLNVLGDNLDVYSIVVLDLTDPEKPLLAEHNGDNKQNVGSVGKLLVAVALFQALADTWPDDLDQRATVLRETRIISDNFVVSDHHTVRFYDVDDQTLSRRTLQEGDQGSLWEYLDWMLSVSSNSAASMVMRDAMLMREFGTAYPPSEAEIDTFFAVTPRAELTRLFQQTFWEPVARNGLALDQIRQGSFFTAQGKKNVDGGGNSYATANTLLQLMLLMEQGRLVDEWSSRQMKRLLYQTERRIRYASAPSLNDAAVYFKSGSLFKCQPEEGFECTPYHGNVYNYMNSVAIVEQEIDGLRLHYLVVLISNVLRKNSAQVHQDIGAAFHELIKRQHGVN